MNTAQEALFKEMLNNGWFTESDGDVEAPTGFFGYAVNTKSELREVLENFSDVVETYGRPADEQIVGVWIASIDNLGVIHIEKIGDFPDDITATASMAHPHTDKAQGLYRLKQSEYGSWASA